MAEDDNTTDELLFDLRCDGSLIDVDFDTYSLASNQPRRLQKRLKERIPQRPSLTDQEYGYCHAQLRQKVNLLVHDVFYPGHLYFVASTGTVFRAQYQPGSVSERSPAYSAASSAAAGDTKTRLQPNLTFVDRDFAVLLSQDGRIELLKTENRHLDKPFVKVFSTEVDVVDGLLLSTASKDNGSSEEGLQKQIDVLICSVQDNTAANAYTGIADSVQFVAQLDWITLQLTKAPTTTADPLPPSWTLARRRVLYGPNVPSFVKFLYTPRTTYLLSCSQAWFKFKTDSLQPVLQSEPEHEKEDSSQETAPAYEYLHTDSEVVIVCPVQTGTTKDEVKVTLTPSHIKIVIRGATILEGSLLGLVYAGSCTWSIIDSNLEVTLMKCSPGQWDGVVQGDSRGKRVFDPAQIEEINERLSQFTESCEGSANDFKSGKEFNIANDEDECDHQSENHSLELFNGDTHKRVAYSNLLNHQVITQIPTTDGPLLVLRHDVDGIVWRFDMDDEGRLLYRHVTSLHAFGYINASHPSSSFVVAYSPSCAQDGPSKVASTAASDTAANNSPAPGGAAPPPSGVFAGIVHWSGQINIFICPQKNEHTKNFAHRAKQYCVDVSSHHPRGAAAMEGALFVLTEDCLHVIEVD